MANAKAILSKEDYTNYRNIRAIAVLFILLGSILALGGTLILFNGAPQSQTPRSAGVPPLEAIILAVVGVCGAIGGIATRRGDRKFAWLIYMMAIPYLLGFPIGTILSYTLLKGLRRYLDSVDQIRAAG